VVFNDTEEDIDLLDYQITFFQTLRPRRR